MIVKTNSNLCDNKDNSRMVTLTPLVTIYTSKGLRYDHKFTKKNNLRNCASLGKDREELNPTNVPFANKI